MRASYTKNTIFVFFIIATLGGCAFMGDVRDNIAGNSLGDLDWDEANIKAQVFDYGLDDCFDKSLAFVKGKMTGVEILKINRRNYSIVLLVSRPTMEDVDGVFSANSADVAVFFKAEGVNKTMVQINSLSSLFAQHAADKIFAELKPSPMPIKEEIEEPGQ